MLNSTWLGQDNRASGEIPESVELASSQTLKFIKRTRISRHLNKDQVPWGWNAFCRGKSLFYKHFVNNP